jgi:SAM-dependent methyltransferase
MLQFIRSADGIDGLPRFDISKWTGVDININHPALARHGYDELREENIETSDSWLCADYDAIVLLHVLEHLYAPEAALGKIIQRMRPGTVLMGGFPSVPDWYAKIHEPKFARTQTPTAM